MQFGRVKTIVSKIYSFRLRRNALILVFLIASALIIYGIFFVLQSNKKTEQISEQTKNQPITQEQYSMLHQSAVTLWKNGSKQQAQQEADKLIEADKKLTKEQRSEILGQQSMVIDALDIQSGSYRSR